MSENLSSKMQGKRKPDYEINKSGLPETYADTKIVLLPRDPVWIYVYWEISQNVRNEISKQFGGEYNPDSLVVRVYDITDVDFNGSNANKYFDINVNPNALSWNINVGEFNRSWCVDLGYVLKNGEFLKVARSNPIIMPRHGVSTVTDEQWALLQIEFEKLLKMSGKGIGEGSYDLVRMMRERWEELLNLPTSGVLPSSISSSFNRPEKSSKNEKDKTFWLKADTEIIVYGATEPDAHLTVQGKSVQLAKDGSFTLRFYLPDGEQSYPIEAVSSCGTMSRKITFNVKKESK